MMLCFRRHLLTDRRWIGDPVDHTLSAWIACSFWQSPHLVELITWLGFLDAKEEAGVFFWRLDFWRAKIARWRWLCLLHPDHVEDLTKSMWGTTH